ncbi:MAG: FliI/YscN family ATPase [Planctomycetota bacterium]
MSVLANETRVARGVQPMELSGHVSAVLGLTVHVAELVAPMGALVTIRTAEGDRIAEVVGFGDGYVAVMPLQSTIGVRAGDAVTLRRARQRAMVSDAMIGRVVDGLSRPLDSGSEIPRMRPRPLLADPVSPLTRPPIRDALRTGVRVVDLMTPLGRGQRIGVFAGPGVGKSTLLGQIARHASAQVNVIALIGERGREVREFIEDSLGEEGLARSVVVVATGDESPPMRVRAARLACAVSEHFRDAGLDVMLMMDSVTRFAHAQRQIGLSVGEPPATKGYTPSVFSELPRLLERAGSFDGAGSITGIYTVLVEGDDLTEPIADAARGILDGHLALSRKLARVGHFPAVDVLESVSRVADNITDAEERSCRKHLARLLGKYGEIEELVKIGAYARGADAEADVAVEMKPRIDDLLRQGTGETTPYERSRSQLVKLATASGEAIRQLAAAQGGGDQRAGGG